MNWKLVAPHLLNSLCTLLVAWLALAGDVVQQHDDTLAVAYERIDKLESQVDALRAELTASHSRHLELLSQLRLGLDPMVVLENFIDPLPQPAWIKEVVTHADRDPDFRMLVVNRAYEDEYGVTRALYEGKTDFEVGLWPLAVAQAFHENDLDIWKKKGSGQYEETFPKLGIMVTRHVVKYLVPIPGGRFGVAGVIFERPTHFGGLLDQDQEAPPESPGDRIVLHVGTRPRPPWIEEE